MAISQEITRLQNAKASLKTSINAKTDQQHQITTETIDEYSNFVDSISGGSGGLDWSALGYDDIPQSIQDGYDYSTQIKNNWDSTITNYGNKFQNNTNLKYMPLVDTSNGTNFSNMFDGCTYLESIPKLNLNSLGASTGMTYMFQNCKELVSVDLSNINATHITSLKNTFYYCEKLKELNLSSWQTNSLTSMNNTFEGCKSLKKLDVRNINFSTLSNHNNIFTLMPKDCLIIVKNQTEKNWVLSKRSDFTNVKTVEEYEAM